jgi:hypothetical protein
MEIKLNKEESEKYFHSALCNGAGYIRGHDLELNWKEKDYKEAKKSLQEKVDKGEIPHTLYHPEYMKKKGEKPEICFEDVLMEILQNGKKLKLIDHGGEYTREITLADVHNRVQKTPLDHLTDMINEQDDAVTADVIIQTVFLEDVIFG